MFGKKKANPENIIRQRWDADALVHDKIIDKIKNEEYLVADLFGSFRDEYLTLWFNNQYLATFPYSEKKYKHLIKHLSLNECDDYVPPFFTEVITARNGTEFFFSGKELLTPHYAIDSVEIEVIENDSGIEILYNQQKIATFTDNDAQTLFIQGFEQALKNNKLQMGLAGRQSTEKLKSSRAREKIEAQSAKLKQKNYKKSEESGFSQVILTTESISPFPVAKRLGIVKSEYVLRHLSPENDQMLFSRSERNEKREIALKKANEGVLLELRREGYQLGADAIVAVTINFSEISLPDDPLTLLSAYGTAIKIDKN